MREFVRALSYGNLARKNRRLERVPSAEVEFAIVARSGGHAVLLQVSAN